MDTVIYKNGGNDYSGIYPEPFAKAKLKYWKDWGKINHQKYIYKGYRYYNNKRDIVIVFDVIQWDNGEKAKRKANGFLGIKEYKI